MAERIRKLKNKTRSPENNISIMPNLSISLPFHEQFFYSCQFALRKFNIRCVPLMSQKLNNIVKLGKDKPEKWMETNIVYKFQCDSCSATYIGQTKRNLKKRIDEHKKIFRKIASNSRTFKWKSFA